VNEIKESLSAMNTKTAGYLMLYGAFLIVMGLLGYLSNPEKAKTVQVGFLALKKNGEFGAYAIQKGFSYLSLPGYNRGRDRFAWRS